jgi:hypothetical protein
MYHFSPQANNPYRFKKMRIFEVSRGWGDAFCSGMGGGDLAIADDLMETAGV